MLINGETTKLSACRNSTSNRYTQAREQSEADLSQSEPQAEGRMFRDPSDLVGYGKRI